MVRFRYRHFSNSMDISEWKGLIIWTFPGKIWSVIFIMDILHSNLNNSGMRVSNSAVVCLNLLSVRLINLLLKELGSEIQY